MVPSIGVKYNMGLEGFREDLYILARTLEESLADSGAASIIEKKWKGGIRVGEYIRQVKERAKEDLPPKIYTMVNKVLEDARLVERFTPSQDDLAGPVRREGTAVKRNDSRDAEDAVRCPDGPVIVFAGPGTGKTRIIERRVEHLVKEKKVVPENILVTTFTNAATDELVDRLRERFEGRPDRDAVLSALNVGTIHSFCYWLVKTYQHRILFLQGTFTPAEERNQLLFIYRNSGRLGLKKLYDRWRAERESEHLLAWKIRKIDFYKEVSQLYNLISEEILNTSPEIQTQYHSILLGEGQSLDHYVNSSVM